MRLSSKAFAACALLSFSPFSFAAVYLGGSGMYSEYSKYDDVKSGFGGSVFAGYRGESIPLMFEVSYLSTGKNKIDGGFTIFDPNTNSSYTFSDMALSFAGEAISVGYFGKFDRKGSGAYAKVGYYTGKSKLDANINGSSGNFKETSNGAMFALGVDWMITPYFGLRADVGSLLSVKDIPVIDPGHKSNVTTANIGVVFAFGGPEENYPSRHPRESRAAPGYSAPAPAPVYSPAVEAAPVTAAPAPFVAAPASVPQPAVEIAPAPVVAAAPAVPSTTVGSAQLVPGAVLRSGPTMKSAGIRTLSDGGPVKLLKRETNAEGPWWSVQLDDGTTGWMIEWGLTRISKN